MHFWQNTAKQGSNFGRAVPIFRIVRATELASFVY